MAVTVGLGIDYFRRSVDRARTAPSLTPIGRRGLAFSLRASTARLAAIVPALVPAAWSSWDDAALIAWWAADPVTPIAVGVEAAAKITLGQAQSAGATAGEIAGRGVDAILAPFRWIWAIVGAVVGIVVLVALALVGLWAVRR